MDYIDVYKRRINRYGLDYQSRIQGQRERNFDDYLLKSIYRVDFWYNDTFVPASLERYKQDYTETQCYLLTHRDLDIPNGTIVMVESQDGSKKPWMVWWKEEIEASGYNRYVVLKMTHRITWRDSKNSYEQWAFFSGPGHSKFLDTLKSSATEAVYKENNNAYVLVTPKNKLLKREVYFKVDNDENSAFTIAELDLNSTPGVAYITADPSYVRDPVDEDEVQDAANFWLGGGAK